MRCGQHVDLELAAVARSGVDVPDRERAGEEREHFAPQPLLDELQGWIGPRRRLGHDAGDGDLFQELQHR